MWRLIASRDACAPLMLSLDVKHAGNYFVSNNALSKDALSKTVAQLLNDQTGQDPHINKDLRGQERSLNLIEEQGTHTYKTDPLCKSLLIWRCATVQRAPQRVARNPGSRRRAKAKTFQLT